MDKFVIFLFVLGTFFNISKGEISQENQDIIRKWMPLYWLHSEEVFNPTNFDYYISQMQVNLHDFGHSISFQGKLNYDLI